MAPPRHDEGALRRVLIHTAHGRDSGMLVRLDTGYAVVHTGARPPLGAEVKLRVPATMFGELSLPAVVRWHSDGAIGLQLGSLRARDVVALHRLSRGALGARAQALMTQASARLRLRREGFELDAIDVVALSRAEMETLVLPSDGDPRRRARLVLRNLTLDVNVLRLATGGIVVSTPVRLTEGLRVGLVVPREAGGEVLVAAVVRASVAGRTRLAYAPRPRREVDLRRAA